MWNFIKLLIFSKTILLTPSPIDLHGEVVIVPEQPLTAISAGAHLTVDVTAIFGGPEAFWKIEEERQKKIPDGTLEARLFTEDGESVLLTYNGLSSSKDKLLAKLFAEDGVSTEVEFVKVVVNSKVPLHDVRITWENASL